MNLTEQTVNSTNQVNVTDSLNSSLMELKIKKTGTTIAPESNELIVYVDQSSSETPTENRKRYVYELIKPLSSCNEVSDEFLIRLGVKNNSVFMETLVKRMVGESEEGLYILEEPIYEILDNSQIILFEGTNFVYTNYENADITLVYPKDNTLNKLYLNSSIYVKDKENHEEHTLEEIYYSMCFTKTEGRIDLEVGHITADCISSKNNKFSLDEEGNLIVNSITVADPISSTDLLSIYPVGSIYMNVSNVSPAELFGGVWEQIKGRFLFATGIPDDNTLSTFGTDLTYNGTDKINATLGTTGGETIHTLTIRQMPSHKHGWLGYLSNKSLGSSGSYDVPLFGSVSSQSLIEAGKGPQSLGGGKAHNNMPPYLAVNMWKRVA